MCNKNASNIETKVWGVIHRRHPQEWGRQWRIKGGDGGEPPRAIRLGGGGNFSYFLGCRKSHSRKKFRFPENIFGRLRQKKILAPGIKWGVANLKSAPGGRHPSYAAGRRGSRRSGHGGEGGQANVDVHFWFKI